MLVKRIKEVPEEIFNDCLNELKTINWNNVIDGRKKGVFKTSTSIHLRSHNTSNLEKYPDSIETFSAIVDCVDNPFFISKFPAHYNAALWIKEEVNGILLGRVMIVHLEPRGKIGIHIDPGAYFDRHSRFHIPLITNPGVQFFDENGNKEHMPVQTLCRLNNLANHGLVNESDDYRVHLIVDVGLAEANSIF